MGLGGCVVLCVGCGICLVCVSVECVLCDVTLYVVWCFCVHGGVGGL